MQHIQGISRHQLQVVSLEDSISQDNPVRFIDAFVHSIHLVRIGFRERVLKSEGRPSFDTKVFLTIYLYGYLNGIRSSRKFEKECFRHRGHCSYSLVPPTTIFDLRFVAELLQKWITAVKPLRLLLLACSLCSFFWMRSKSL